MASKFLDTTHEVQKRFSNYGPQAGFTRRTIIRAAIAGMAGLADSGCHSERTESQGEPSIIGLARDIRFLNLEERRLSANGFRTSGYLHVGLGSARYRVKSPEESEAPGDLISADGLRLGLSESTLMPEHFGAIGDGQSDDTDAFLALSKLIERRGGGKVAFRPGATYLVGRQRKNGAGVPIIGLPILAVTNVRHFILDGRGATMKMKGGLYFGGFDRQLAPTASHPNFDRHQKATQGWLIRLKAVENVEVRNVRLDGNGRQGVIGGFWGDKGRQCSAYGLYLAECKRASIENVDAADFLLDGIAMSNYNGMGADKEPRPHRFVNCQVRNSGRNCFSLVGGVSVTFVNCTFENGGFCANQTVPENQRYVSSAPASCFDVEAQRTVIRDVLFENCRFIAGSTSHTAFVADSGDSRRIILRTCLIDGNLWLAKPECLVERCEINGCIRVLYGGRGDGSDARISQCHGTDVSSASGVLGRLFIDTQGRGGHQLIEESRFTLTGSRLNLRGATVRRCEFILKFGTETARNKTYAVLLNGLNTHLEDVVFVDQIGTASEDPPPTNEGYFIAAGKAEILKSRIEASPRFTLKWQSASSGYPNVRNSEGLYTRLAPADR